ncbi:MULTISPECIES: diguanylate cyclase domain-containing protein [unclassified Adlercreutzia]|uniref:diguanylate cyclase domain-containing protein n=1 Tax=unclassified Adlercreutzia TaxID=2636013 RepID=UPI0013EB8DF4|nr:MULTISPECIES: diguanylate cyclase [unclassified Adlercreutzia]
MSTLRQILRRYVVALSLVSIIVLLGATICLQIGNEQKHAYDIATQTLSQIEQVLNDNDRAIAEAHEEYHRECLNNASVIARVIEGDPGVISSVDSMKELALISGVDEIHIFDETGRIFAGTHPQYYGYTFDSGEQMSFFKPMLEDKSLQLVQEITPNTAEGKMMQYSAIWSRNGDVIVEVGMEPTRVMKATEENELSYLFSLFRVNPEASYFAIDARSGRIIGSTNESDVGHTANDVGLSIDDIESKPDGFSATVNGRQSFCVFQQVDDVYLGRTVSNADLYHRIPEAALLLFLCLALVVGVLSAAISFCINRFVVGKINDVNRELGHITQGNLNETVDVRGSREFSELSDHLNVMIKAILRNSEKMSYVLAKTNLLIGVYEHNEATGQVVCSEYLPEVLNLTDAQLTELAADFNRFEQFIDGIRANPVPGEESIFLLPGEGDKRPGKYLKIGETVEHSSVFGVVIDVTETVMRRKQIERERDRDPLTGLYNRRGLDSKLAALFQAPGELGFSAFAMIDADDLKMVNDTYGHDKGDIYLRRVSEIIKDFGPHRSVVARQSGDEFVLFLYGYESKGELLGTLEELAGMQDRTHAQLDDALEIPLRFSLGYSLTRRDADYREAIKRADRLMYANKRERKGDYL